MEQFRQVGEILGSLNALMIFRHEIKINQRQCILLYDSFKLAFESISEEIKKHLKLAENSSKWKALENPLKELQRIFRDGELFIKNCIEPKDFWGKAVALSRSSDCVHLHLHNLLWCVFIVIEVIEAVSEISGSSQEEMNKKKMVFLYKYDKDWMDSLLFQHKFGRLYLVDEEMCKRLNSVVKEDHWVLSEFLYEKKNRISEMLQSPRTRVHPCSVLVGSPAYQVRRRLEGSKSNYKEIQWMGESFTMKHAIGEEEVEIVLSEFYLHSSLELAHPNVMNYLYAFCNEQEKKKECYVLMELMNKDLSTHIKEVSTLRKRVPFHLLVAVDIMLQVARGMEYLHAKKIYHGDLNPFNILVKLRNSWSPDSYVQVKVANFGVSNSKSSTRRVLSQTAAPCIWFAPEVLLEQEKLVSMSDSSNHSKYSEKADVYSFGMICFELTTGKIPFEECHLEGDKIMSRNIRAGERPLFTFPSPRYLVSLIRRCWQTDPLQRPTFSSICRVLRYVKRSLIINPELFGQSQSEPLTPSPSVDYFDLETGIKKRVVNWGTKEFSEVSDIPFELYAYKVMERGERTNANFVKEKSSDVVTSESWIFVEENRLNSEEVLPSPNSAKLLQNIGSEGAKKATLMKKVDGKASKQTGQQQKVRTAKPGPISSCARSLRMNSGDHLHPVAMSPRRTSGPTSD